MMDLLVGLTQTATAIALAFALRNVWAIVGLRRVRRERDQGLGYVQAVPGQSASISTRSRSGCGSLEVLAVVTICRFPMLLVGQFDKLVLASFSLDMSASISSQRHRRRHPSHLHSITPQRSFTPSSLRLPARDYRSPGHYGSWRNYLSTFTRFAAED